MFEESCSDIKELTDVVSSYVCLCEDNVTLKKSVKIFPISKPWVTKQLKVLLNKKSKAFHNGNLLRLHFLKKEMKKEIIGAKLKYTEKIERDLGRNNFGQ